MSPSGGISRLRSKSKKKISASTCGICRASAAWNRHLEKEVESVEAVDRRVTRDYQDCMV